MLDYYIQKLESKLKKCCKNQDYSITFKESNLDVGYNWDTIEYTNNKIFKLKVFIILPFKDGGEKVVIIFEIGKGLHETDLNFLDYADNISVLKEDRSYKMSEINLEDKDWQDIGIFIDRIVLPLKEYSEEFLNNLDFYYSGMKGRYNKDYEDD